MSSNQIKVCHVSSVHRNDDVRILTKECVSLKKIGYDVYYVTQGNSMIKNGINIIGIGNLPKSRIKRMLLTAKNAYKKALEINANIYHLHDPELLPYAIKLKQKGKKVIFDSHENYGLVINNKHYMNKFFRNLISKLYIKYESYVIGKIDGVIIPCTFEGKNIFEGIAKKVAIISNMPRISEFLTISESQLKDKKKICYIGSLSESRGITHLIKAAAQAKVTLILGGALGSPDYLTKLKQIPEFSYVDFRGYVTHDKIINVYSEASIGISTYLKVGQYGKADTFATKVFDYMALGIPVILTDDNYAREIMKIYKFGICVQPDNINEISEAICYLFDNPDIAYSMGVAGKIAIKEMFNWDIEEKKLELFYKSIL